ncbi:protein translocase subunit SecD [Zavarzinia sp.]|uniref:protein translocase subunit SecD n=1 Tax=Zavarzinia sp. TaxID=2027920 RepID=UPI003BB7097D
MIQYSRWKIMLYMAIVALGVIFAAPNLFSRASLEGLPSWVPQKQVNLGLDLRGGSHLLLEVDVGAVVKERLEALVDSTRSALVGAGIRYTGLGVSGQSVNVTVTDTTKLEEARQLLRGLASPVGGGVLGGGVPDIDVAQTDGKFTLTLSPAGIQERTTGAISQSLEIVRRRIDATGTAEATVARQGADQILIQLPGVQDPARIKNLLGQTAKMTFRLVENVDPTELLAGRAPAGTEILQGEPVAGTNAPEPLAVRKKVLLTGEMLVDARAQADPQSGEWVVSFRFDAEGAKRFAAVTRENVGRRFAIVLDGKAISAPVIREAILGGQGQISGNFNVQSANDLSVLLRAGALPAPLTVIEERTVGPDLGSDAIAAGQISGLIGTAFVIVFMVLFYSVTGVIAVVALIANIVLTIALLTLMGATLTLPGIAGLVLSVGIAVDANVLINERIREETLMGRGAMAALHQGFDRAYATIIDSHLTALFAVATLFFFGEGPVRGFAITMGIGIILSLFTAVALVRVGMVYWVKWTKKKILDIHALFGARKIIPENTSIRFMRGRFIGIATSAVLSTASIVLFFYPGLHYGIDFAGGIVVEVRTEGPADLAKMRSALDSLKLGEVSLQEFGSPSDVLLRLPRQGGGEAAQGAAVEQVRAKLAEIAPGANLRRVEVVGPRVSEQLVGSGILAVVLSFGAMLIYIWWRFEWQFAVGAVLTLILDITKTVGFFAITGIEFNLTAIAALLTLIGYSMNDKVVVYDRMRENLRKYKTMPLRELIDLSINSTLTRTIFTSVTTFLAMAPMAVFGGSAVSGFAQVILFGVVVGTSSSIFIAAPILLFLGEGKLRRGSPAAAAPTGGTQAQKG